MYELDAPWIPDKRQTQKRYYGRTFKMNSGPYKQNHKIVVKIAKRGKG